MIVYSKIMVYSFFKINNNLRKATKLYGFVAFLFAAERWGERSMKELILMIRPEKLEKVKQIMDDAGCGGMTISSAMGCGSQRGIVKEF